MSKKITVSFSDVIYNKFLANFSGNKSRHIQDHFVIGLDSELGDNSQYKNLAFEFKQKNIELTEEIRKIKAKYEKLKTDMDKWRRKPENDPELQAQKILTDSIKASGTLHDLM